LTACEDASAAAGRATSAAAARRAERFIRRSVRDDERPPSIKRPGAQSRRRHTPE
jgi:hypothetical protein